MASEIVEYSIVSYHVRNSFDDKRRYDIGLALYNLMHDPSKPLINPVVFSFPEASGPGEFGAQQVSETLHNYSTGPEYETVGIDYETADGRLDDHALVVAYDKRLLNDGKVEVIPVRLETRNSLLLKIESPLVGEALTLMPFHGDDRREVRTNHNDPNETSRLGQVIAAIDVLAPYYDAMLVGNFNALNRKNASARVARFLGEALSFMRPESIDPDPITAKRDLLKRIFAWAEFSDGRTIDAIIQAGFKDADKHTLFPTKTANLALPPWPIGLAPDHIFYRGRMRRVGLRTIKSLASDHLGQAATFKAKRNVDKYL